MAHSTSADAVAGNDDLLREILLRLPAKPLTQFKCVSHRWLSLASDPQFSLHHARRNRRPVSALFLRSFRAKPEFSFVPLDDCILDSPHFQFLGHSGTTILHSSNGLLCYSKSEDGESGSILEYYVCNPTTKRSTKIPLMGLIRNCRIRRRYFRVEHRLCSVKSEGSAQVAIELNINLLGIYVAFDPLISPQYRVVCVWEYNACVFNYEVKIAVYQSESGSWGEPMGPFTVPYALYFNNGAYWNGKMHWISNSHIMCFDIDGGYLRIAQLPLNCKIQKVLYFGESGGHLHLVVNDKANDCQLNVLQMESDYSGWEVKYCCDLDPMIINPLDIVSSHLPCASSVLYLGWGERENDSHLILASNGKLICYNIKKKTSEKLLDLPPPCYKIVGAPVAHYKAFPYEETVFEV